MRKLSVFVIAALLCLSSLFLVFSVSAADSVVYISDAGYDGSNGSSPDAAVATLDRAYTLLAGGGTLVVSGETEIPAGFMAPVCTGAIRVTSVYDGVDYRKTANARLVLMGNLYLSSETAFGDVDFYIGANNATIVANNNKLVMDNGINCTKKDSVPNFASITAGTFSATNTITDDSKPSDLTVNSGSWRVIRLGNRAKATAEIEGNMKLVINGGEFFSNVAAGGASRIVGNIDTVINGGTFHGKVSASYNGSEAVANVDGNVSLTINGGTFMNEIDLCAGDKDRVSGTGTLTVTGGKFDVVLIISGDGCTGGSKADISGYQPTASLLGKLVKFDEVVTEGAPKPAETEATTKTPEVTKTPETTTKTPETTTKTPENTTKAPETTTKAPETTTKTPATTTKTPATTTKTPENTTKAPAATTEPVTAPSTEPVTEPVTEPSSEETPAVTTEPTAEVTKASEETPAATTAATDAAPATSGVYPLILWIVIALLAVTVIIMAVALRKKRG